MSFLSHFRLSFWPTKLQKCLFTFLKRLACLAFQTETIIKKITQPKLAKMKNKLTKISRATFFIEYFKKKCSKRFDSLVRFWCLEIQLEKKPLFIILWIQTPNNYHVFGTILDLSLNWWLLERILHSRLADFTIRLFSPDSSTK